MRIFQQGVFSENFVKGGKIVVVSEGGGQSGCGVEYACAENFDMPRPLLTLKEVFFLGYCSIL